MDVVVHGRHVELSQKFRDHVTEKVGRLDRFGVPLAHVDVEVTKEPNPRQADRAFEVELTCRGKGPVIRAEAYSADKYAALELAYDRLEERLRRAADRKVSARRHGNGELPPVAPVEPLSAPEPEDEEQDDAVLRDGPIVVREKTHASSPMSVSEALDHMELVGHDFYLFLDSDTSLPSVVYRRRGFDYGLIRLSV